MTLLVALVATVCVVVLARDVRSDAARQPGHRAELNLSFASLSRAVLANEDVFAHRAGDLLGHGGSMTRVQFAGVMSLTLLEGREVEQEAGLLASPHLDDDAQAHLITVVTARVVGVSELLARAAAAVSLPHPHEPWPGVSSIQASFSGSDSLWSGTVTALASAPGHAHLAASVFPLTAAPLGPDLAALAASPTLAPVRAVTIATVSIAPAPFPAPPRDVVLPPTSSMVVDVVVRNEEYINQKVTVTAVFTPSGASAPTTRVAHLALAPLGAFAADLARIPVSASERGTLVITLSGAPVAAHGTGTTTYAVTVSPSPTL